MNTATLRNWPRAVAVGAFLRKMDDDDDEDSDSRQACFLRRENRDTLQRARERGTSSARSVGASRRRKGREEGGVDFAHTHTHIRALSTFLPDQVRKLGLVHEVFKK